jgi:hypothetical protein
LFTELTPLWAPFLAGEADEIARRYLARNLRAKTTDDVAAPAALLYLGVEQHGEDKNLVLPLAEARWYSTRNKVLGALYKRAANSPALDLNAEVGRWFVSIAPHHHTGAMQLLTELLGYEKDEAGRKAFVAKYEIASRLPKIRDLLTAETEYVRTAAQELLDALKKAGVE